MTHRENYLRTVQFRHPEWIQIDICINEAMWNYYGRELETVLLRHPAVFPDYKKRSGLDNLPKFDLDRLNTERVVDRWGCTWVFPIPGMDGAVVGHPLLQDVLERYARDVLHDDVAGPVVVRDEVVDLDDQRVLD
ncbi:MAG TPA: hypothetical protein PLE55_03010, partial [Clostridiales bacterium]|nr:hypothetical protein [Clostridiales bacterium]